MQRRKVLLGLTAIVGSIGAAFAAVPFVRYFLPSERAKALGAPISIDLSTMQPGSLRSYEWRGQPVLVLRRTPAQLESLAVSGDYLLDDQVRDGAQPGYVDAGHRALNPEFLVLLGNCTHLGCVPNLDTDTGKGLLGGWWPGGFHCPCHDSLYDYAGRVVRGPAPANLRVPPHRFLSATTLIIGEDAAPA